MMVAWLLCLACWLMMAKADMKKPSNTVEDDHRYYTLSVYQNNLDGKFDEYFINMENAKVREGLSQYQVGAEQISPKFPFPFYGHNVDKFYITTHGFLSLSNRLHDYIYKTQYIAPLRVKLDPSRSNSSTISVLSLEDRFTVEWSNVSVLEEAEHHTGGSFTFQVTLWPNGNIVFVYIDIQPVLTTAALYDMEPVAGISDAFLLNESELHLYNKINIDNVDINTRTVAFFRALPTCVSAKNCMQCEVTRNNTPFACSWCESSGHCSDGTDRLRQAWNDNQCHLANSTTCPGHTEWRNSVSPSLLAANGLGEVSALNTATASTQTVVSAVVSTILVILLLGLLLGFLYLYGRYNESSAAGRYLKRLRQSYHRFGAAAKSTSLELGRKRTELLVGKSTNTATINNNNNINNNNGGGPKVVSEFVNPHPMTTTNNVITAAM